MLYKSMTLLVLVALAACVFAINDIVQEDQAAAEQSYRIHKKPETWYQYGVNAFPLSGPSLVFFRPPSFNLLRLNDADRVDYSPASYPSDFFVRVRHFARPYVIEAAAENQYGAATYSYGFRGYPFAGYPSAVYPSAAASTAVKNVAYPYTITIYPPPHYVYGFNTYPYGTYQAVGLPSPYATAAPAAAPAKA